MILTTRNKDYTELNLITVFAYLAGHFVYYTIMFTQSSTLDFFSVYNCGGINQYLSGFISIRVFFQKFSVYTVETYILIINLNIFQNSTIFINSRSSDITQTILY